MSEREADVFYEPEQPSNLPAKVSVPALPVAQRHAVIEERGADIMYSPPPPPPPGPRTVAKASAAQTDGDIMFGIAKPPAASTRPQAPARASTDLIEVLPGMSLRIDADRFTEFDQEGLDLMAPIIERHNIPGPAVQELFDLHLEQLEQEGAAAQYALLEHQDQHFAALKAEWRRECEADPGLKAFGMKKAKDVGKEVLSTYFDPSLREALQGFGLLNHPGLVRTLLHLQESLTVARMHGTGYNYKRKYLPGYARLANKPTKTAKRG